jgi:hypothetical protein
VLDDKARTTHVQVLFLVMAAGLRLRRLENYGEKQQGSGSSSIVGGRVAQCIESLVVMYRTNHTILISVDLTKSSAHSDENQV